MEKRIVLTLVDTMQIQRYIFASNRLREMVGASALLKKVTEDWLVEAIYKEYGITFPGKDILEVLKKQDAIDNDAPFEIIYCGGGNAKILFSGEEKAKSIVRKWSRKLLDTAPGLQIAVHHHLVDLAKAGHFNEIIDEAEAELARHKANFVPNVSELAPPFAARCPSTGMPAEKHYGKDNERLSEQAWKKRERADESFKEWMVENGQWKLFLNGKDAAFPQNLDELGQKEGANYVGIIHADGNFMGQKVLSLAERYPSLRSYVNNIRKFSIRLENSNREAFRQVVNWIGENYTDWCKQGALKAGVTIREGKYTGKYAFPIRPIIMGGDDFTAVTPGAIALQVAEKFMMEFRESAGKWCKEFGISEITASGGVALVHSHMPFDRAYRLADSLATSAKQVEREKRKAKSAEEIKEIPEASWLDWYIVSDNQLDEVDELRVEKYRYHSDDKLVRLTRKPYRVDKPENGEASFAALKKDVESLQDKDKFPRNKLKRLLNVAVEGPTQAEMALREMKYHLKSDEFKHLIKILKQHHGHEALFRLEKGNELSTAILDLVESLEFIVKE